MNIQSIRPFLLLMIIAISICAIGQTTRRVPAGSGRMGNMTRGSNSVLGGIGLVTNESPNAANSIDPDQQNIWKVLFELGLTPGRSAQFASSVAAYNVGHAGLDKALRDVWSALALARTNDLTVLDVEIEGVTSANPKGRMLTSNRGRPLCNMFPQPAEPNAQQANSVITGGLAA
jgi:hypothetical protein